MKRGLFLLLVLILTCSVTASPFFKVSCSNQGILRMYLNKDQSFSDIDSIEYGVDKQDMTHLRGEWIGFYNSENLTGVAATVVSPIKLGDLFVSEQTFFISGDYYVRTVSEDNQYFDKFHCPGITFDCSLLNFTIKDCYTKDDYFYATLYTEGIDKNRLTGRELLDIEDSFIYELRTKNNYKDIYDNFLKTGSMPNNYWITYLEDGISLYQAPLLNNEVKDFKITFKENDLIIETCSNTKQYEFLPYYSFMKCRIEESNKTIETTSTTTTTLQQVQPVIVKNEPPNYTTPALIVSIALIIVALIIKGFKKKKVHHFYEE